MLLNLRPEVKSPVDRTYRLCYRQFTPTLVVSVTVGVLRARSRSKTGKHCDFKSAFMHIRPRRLSRDVWYLVERSDLRAIAWREMVNSVLSWCICGCVRERRSLRSDRSDRSKTSSVNGRNVGGVWSDRTHSVRKCVGSVGNFDRSPNTDRSISISIDVNKIADDALRISRKVCCSLKLRHHWQKTFGNAQDCQIDLTRLSER
jgi:hypothetical protein